MLPASFCPKDVPSPGTQDHASDVAGDDSASDSASFLDDSEDGEANEEHMFNLLTLARSTVLACGRFANATVNQVREDDDGSTELIPLVCKQNASNEDPKHRL